MLAGVTSVTIFVAIEPFRFEALDGGLGDAFLRYAVIPDAGAILGADIVALAVERGRIVRGEEYVQDIFKADDVIVEGDVDHFGVTGGFGADLLIR